MSTLRIIQFIQIFISYSLITILLPFLILRNKFRQEPISKQFLIYFTIGNFYIINLVFILQILHISNIFTLIISTLFISLYAWSRVNNLSLKDKIYGFVDVQINKTRNVLGRKTNLLNKLNTLKNAFKKALLVFYEKVIKKPLQWIFIVIIFVGLFWIYGKQLYQVYGYMSSDIPVHMEWINQLSRGVLFSGGIYPFGFHCMIYYLHTVFGFDVYVLLSTFYLVQCIYIHLVLFAVLKGLCKSRFIPYFGTILYLFPNVWFEETYSRFGSSLPQEFGMIFILPSIYFFILFFRTHKEDINNTETKWIILCFICAFSLTFIIHFYGTFIAVLGCIGVVVGYIYKFVKKDYFLRAIKAGILSMIIAIAPMLIAYIQGTPLQGSLGWGISVINKNSSQLEEGSKKNNIIISQKYKKNNKKKYYSSNIKRIYYNSLFKYKYLNYRKTFVKIVLISIPLLFVSGALFILLRKTNYGSMLISISLLMLLMSALLLARLFNLPQLMNESRTSIYYVYTYILCITLLIDALIYLLVMPEGLKGIRNMLSLCICTALMVSIVRFDIMKNPEYKSNYMTNGAYTSITNIIKENKDYTWTIVSSNDELQMGYDHGRHYETITFLKNMKKINKNTKINIPTENVYIFIEKVPLTYSNKPNKGRRISLTGAKKPIPKGEGVAPYSNTSRWIVMSKMYSWVKAFKGKYPYDITTYYEDDSFVCYKIKQNTMSLYNFALDYGFNK